MIWEQEIRAALSPDPLEEAQSRRRMGVAGEIIAQRYEAMHGGALRRKRGSVPTEQSSNPAAQRVAS